MRKLATLLGLSESSDGRIAKTSTNSGVGWTKGLFTNMITNLNLRKVENGYFLDYWVDGKAKQRVFYTWEELCTWLKEQVTT